MMTIDVLNARVYTIHAFADTFRVTVSFSNDGTPCEILINFPPECDIPNREKLIIEGLTRSWTMLLNNGVSVKDIVKQSLPHNGSNDKFLNDLVQILQEN